MFAWLWSRFFFDQATLQTLLHSCRDGHDELLRSLLEDHDDESNTNNSRNSRNNARALVNVPLHYIRSGHTSSLDLAAESGHVSIVQMLLAYGAKVNQALLFAAMRGHVAIVKLLLDRGGADVNASFDCTALHLAVSSGNVDVIRLLLDRGADINAQTEDLETPLYLACRAGAVPAVRLLLERGADWRIASKFGTPLHGVVGFGSRCLDRIRLLVVFGFDVTARPAVLGDSQPLFTSTSGLPILNAEEEEGFSLETPNIHVVAELLSYGADANQMNRYGFTPVHCAILKSATVGRAVLDLLGGAVAENLNATDDEGNTVLHYLTAEDKVLAYYNQGCNELRILLEAGCNPNVANHRGETPLHLVARRSDDGRGEFLRLLQKHGADVNAQNADGDTALHIVCRHGFGNRAMELLRHATTDLRLTNRLDMDAYDVAVLYKQVHIAEMILEYHVASVWWQQKVVALAVLRQKEEQRRRPFFHGKDISALSTYFWVVPTCLALATVPLILLERRQLTRGGER